MVTKIGLANGYFLKLWAAPPTRNLAENPPPPVTMIQLPGRMFVIYKLLVLIFINPYTGYQAPF